MRVVNKWISFLKKLKAPQLPVGLLLSLSFLTGCATAPQQNPYMLPGAGLGAALGLGWGSPPVPIIPGRVQPLAEFWALR